MFTKCVRKIKDRSRKSKMFDWIHVGSCQSNRDGGQGAENRKSVVQCPENPENFKKHQEWFLVPSEATR